MFENHKEDSVGCCAPDEKPEETINLSIGQKMKKPRTAEDIEKYIVGETKELNIVADLHNALLAFLESDDFELEFEGENVFYTILGKLEMLIIRHGGLIEANQELLRNL